MKNFISSQTNQYELINGASFKEKKETYPFKSSITIQTETLFKEASSRITGRKVKFKND